MNKLINVLVVAGLLGLMFFIASLLDFKYRLDFIIVTFAAVYAMSWIYKMFSDEDSFQTHMVVLTAIGAGVFSAWASEWWGLTAFLIVAIFSKTGVYKSMYFLLTGMSFNFLSKK